MAKIYPLGLITPDDVILIEVMVKRHASLLVLDTGATNTIIDVNTLLIAGYGKDKLFTGIKKNLKQQMESLRQKK